MTDIVLHAARVGKVGGLRHFADALAESFEGASQVVALVPEGVRLNSTIPQRSVPKWIASSGRVTAARPILWWIYSASFLADLRGKRVLCSTHHTLPFHRHQIAVVHDLRPYFHPDNWAQHVNFHYFLPRALRRCDGILTVSETSKDLLVSAYQMPPSKIFVVPNIVDCEFFLPGSEMIEPRAVGQYLLTVGSSWKHKNVCELLKMQEFWRDKYRLKIVGANGQYIDFLKKMTLTMGLGKQVDFLNGLTADQLRDLYRNCSALVYPSTMEGFGLPPLEAMACGRPVIVSDIPVFRELYGDAPIYVKLKDRESWRKAFEMLTAHSETQVRLGLECAKSFSRERFRTALYDALERIWSKESLLEVFGRR